MPLQSAADAHTISCRTAACIAYAVPPFWVRMARPLGLDDRMPLRPMTTGRHLMQVLLRWEDNPGSVVHGPRVPAG